MLYAKYCTEVFYQSFKVSKQFRGKASELFPNSSNEKLPNEVELFCRYFSIPLRFTQEISDLPNCKGVTGIISCLFYFCVL